MPNFNLQKMRIKLESFDCCILDKAVHDISLAANETNAVVYGPIPLPVKLKEVIVNRSTHVNKKSREKFEMKVHRRMLVVHLDGDTVDSFMKLSLSPGADVDIKLF